MYISSENIRKFVFFKRPFLLGEIAEKTAAVLILISLFLTWIFFPLSIDKNSFQIESQLYFSYGYILLTLLILYLLGLRFALPFIILFIFSFPIKLVGNYEFVARLLDELY